MNQRVVWIMIVSKLAVKDIDDKSDANLISSGINSE
jgi:hypothetical protein